MPNPLELDLEQVLARTRPMWDELRGSRVFLTGGTGFVGCWLLETFTWAVDRLGLGAEVVVLSRRPDRFDQKAPHLARHPAVKVVSGDVRSAAFPAGRFPFVVHAAAEADASANEADPVGMLETMLDGTRRVLEFARSARCQKLLIVSSGAVYGPQPQDVQRLGEDYLGAPDLGSAKSAYGEAKRVSEFLATMHARRHGYEAKIARGFAFVGPWLPLDLHFAVGNFIRDALAGGPVVVRGDGSPWRSYLYAADLATWLWTILLRGAPGRPYNVGSEDALTVGELAHRVGKLVEPAARVEVLGRADPARPAERYVPAVSRAKEELGLVPSVGLDEAILRTMRWARATGAVGPAGAEPVRLVPGG